MKANKIKINESQPRNMVSKIIKESLSIENVNSQPQFRQVDNLYNYINQNNIQMRQASKFARINAVQARGGERINTVAGDGTQETTNVAKPGDFIVNNVGNPNNKWIIDAATFQKKYVPVQGQPGVFMPKGGPMMAGQINEPISFTAPWGEKMNIDKGGYIMQTPGSQTDIYGISGRDFNDTYRFDKLEEQKEIKMNESQIREMIQKIISESLNELSPNYYSANAQKAQNALNGFGGKMMKTFSPNKYNKIQNQAQRFQSYSNDHPDDTYDITSYQWADPMHINNGYQIRNNRTGNVKGFNDANKTIPIRGSVTSNGKYGGEASYLNGMKKMNESQLREMISKAIRESLEEAGYGSLKTTSIYDPIGYFACKENVYNSIMRNGFNPEMLDNGEHSLLGKGFYFYTEVPGKDMQRFYGDKVIKVRVLGEYEAYDSGGFGGKIFVVRPNDADNIEIIQDENPYGDSVGQWTTTMSSDIYESKLRKFISKVIKESLEEMTSNGGENDIFNVAYGIVSNAIDEITRQFGCAPQDAENAIRQVLDTFDADDMADEDDY